VSGPQQATSRIDRDLVVNLGLTQQGVGAALGAALGGGYVNYFSIAGRSYKVIPQVLQKDRLNPDQLLFINAGLATLNIYTQVGLGAVVERTCQVSEPLQSGGPWFFGGGTFQFRVPPAEERALQPLTEPQRATPRNGRRQHAPSTSGGLVRWATVAACLISVKNDSQFP
jgi:hypothetical protein